MAGRKGIDGARRMRGWADKKGGSRPGPGRQDTGLLDALAARWLRALAVRNHSPSGIATRRKHLSGFLAWAAERGLREPGGITRSHLESYQRHLWRWRKKDGKPLGVSTRRGHLYTLRGFFRWLSRERLIEANAASELEAPREEPRLPADALSPPQVAALMAVPDTRDPLGVRGRAILELLYSAGIRRAEAAGLRTDDLSREGRRIRVTGKGRKERIVPVGDRAMLWLGKYLGSSRPLLEVSPSERALFLTGYGSGFSPDSLGRLVRGFFRKAGLEGSCHLLRHTCATHMIEGGADIRYIQQLLGHSQLGTTAIYTRVAIRQLQEVHARCHPAGAGPHL